MFILKKAKETESKVEANMYNKRTSSSSQR